MQCKNRWERDFLIKATLKSFVNGEYHRHRSQLLLEQEKSRLPETMPLVENYLKVGEERQKKKAMRERIASLRQELYQCRRAEQIYAENIRRYSHGETGASEKREFKRACPVADCLGFLSTQWKCGVCNIWVCHTCMEIKGQHKDDPHECNPDTVATAQLLKKDTKNCPSCAAMIHKISGCDQMWCTQCHIAFSWRTGRRVNGVVHNPHFYQWQREGGGAGGGGGGGAPNAPGAAVCGGLPNLYTIRALMARFDVQWRVAPAATCYLPDTYARIASATPHANIDLRLHRIVYFLGRMHRAVTHFSHVTLQSIRERCQRVGNNTDLRIKYAIKEISEDKLKSDVARRDKAHQKSTAILHIYELLNTVFVESFRDIVAVGQALVDDDAMPLATRRARWEECLQRNLKRCNEVRLYGNRELVKISVMYSQHVCGLRGDFYSADSRKFATIDLENNTGTLFT